MSLSYLFIPRVIFYRRRHDRNVDEYRELMAVRVLVHRFARRMRVAVNELQEARNLIRQEVVNRGFIEPDYHFEQVVNLRRDGNFGQLNNNWDLAVFRKGFAFLDLSLMSVYLYGDSSSGTFKINKI